MLSDYLSWQCDHLAAVSDHPDYSEAGVPSLWATEASSVFTAAPHHLHYGLSASRCQISSGIDLS